MNDRFAVIPSRVSVIVSIYKDIDALDLVLEALAGQTARDFEIVVSEDGQDAEVRRYIESQSVPCVHVGGPDVGWTKNRALNRAVCAASGDYLIFIDGDCVPHSRYVESHLALAEVRTAVSGRRVDIGPRYADRLTKRSLRLKQLERPAWLLIHYPGLIRDRARALEDGLYVRPGSWFQKRWLSKLSRIRGILGCNFACWKSDLLEINGFDEDYDSPAVGEDADLMWRFAHIGVSIKSCRNMAIVYHFRHPLRFDGFDENMKKMSRKRASGK
jgi:glycosyltransferase involved in cell wall biosynthesis